MIEVGGSDESRWAIRVTELERQVGAMNLEDLQKLLAEVETRTAKGLRAARLIRAEIARRERG